MSNDRQGGISRLKHLIGPRIPWNAPSISLITSCHTVLKQLQSLTGKEFACYHNIERETAIRVYFADPYASWQRGSNENANGLISEFSLRKRI
ncbi:IS30 family transposase [Alkalibacillus flavidus]|uniref:IS30 family transposase n=1 Tax=Alkalibacillus flavidus TaxID=546021 RepID=A0ABV2KWJ0_9BACI